MFQEETPFRGFSPIFDEHSRRTQKSHRLRLSNMSPDIQNVFEFGECAPTNFYVNYVSDFDADRMSMELLESPRNNSKRDRPQDNHNNASHKIKKTLVKDHCLKISSKGNRRPNKKHRKASELGNDSATHFTRSTLPLEDGLSLHTITAEPTTREAEKGLCKVDWKQVAPLTGVVISLGTNKNSTIKFTMRPNVDKKSLIKNKRSVSFCMRSLNPSTLKF
jgi:hypothetical protein